ncbi:MAG: DUF5689 domain-containing protein [Gemmatimonadota bacterium]
MKQLRRLFTGVLALAAVSACDDGTDPVATATVEVLAYVDADNSNDFDSAADDPIEGATVTLTMVGTDNELEATTGADGVAVFSAVEVGSYTVAIELPATLTGVTLASASAPSVVVEEDVTADAEFRYTYVPGTITGHAFLGTGDYADGAVVVPGLEVTLLQDGTELATEETDASGAYTFNGRMPGDYTVAVEVPAYLSTASATQDVTVAADAEVTADFGLEANVTHTIAEARDAAEGDTVAVSGVAITGTAGDQAALSGSSFYIQDDSGMYIYLAGVSASVELGDQVLVYGTRGQYRGEVQLASLAVLVTGEGTLPTPTEVTAAEINDGEHQAQLAIVQDLYVTDVEMEDGDPTGNVWTSTLDTFERLLVYVDADAGIDLTTDISEGSVYDFTGVVAHYDGMNELKPRMPADIVEDTDVLAAVTTVSDVRAESDGAAVEVTGVVTEAGTLEGNGFYMEDPTGGIFVYMGYGNVPADLAIGDVVTVTGERDSYYDVVQIGGSPTVVETGATVTPVPASITPAELNTGDYQGRLVVLDDVVASTIDGSNIYVKASAEATDSAVIRIDSDSGISASAFVEGDSYTITGVVTTYAGTEQVKPRFSEDVEGIVVVQPTVMTVAEARDADMGTLVEVSGVVTVDGANLGGTSYIQADGAGISIYWAGDSEEGEDVTVVGEIDEYNGNIQIALQDIVVNGTATVPDPVVITGTQLNDGEEPGELAELESFTVTDVEVTNSYDTHVVTGTAGDGAEVKLYVDNRTGIASTDWAVDTAYIVTGIVAYRSDGWYLWPRKTGDRATQ